MSNPTSKTFDCMQSMRQMRDALSAEIGNMSYDELTRWLRIASVLGPVSPALGREGCPASRCSGPAFGRPLIGEKLGCFGLTASW